MEVGDRPEVATVAAAQRRIRPRNKFDERWVLGPLIRGDHEGKLNGAYIVLNRKTLNNNRIALPIPLPSPYPSLERFADGSPAVLPLASAELLICISGGAPVALVILTASFSCGFDNTM